MDRYKNTTLKSKGPKWNLKMKEFMSYVKINLETINAFSLVFSWTFLVVRNKVFV